MRRRRTWCEGADARLRCLALVTICLGAYLPGFFSLPPVDRDESRFAQASRQMIESGTWEGWVVPRLQNQPRLNKPPLVYWCQAGMGWLLGEAHAQAPSKDPQGFKWGGKIWVYRLPSLAAALIAVLATWRFGCALFDPRTAWLGALLLGCCPMLAWDARQARADQVLLAATVMSQWMLWTIWSHRAHPERLRWRPMLFWVFVTIGIMAKGPVTPAIVAMTVVFHSLARREWRWIGRLRPLMGALIMASIVGPWVYLVASRVGWGAYLWTITDETVGRSLVVKEGHWGPPGYHLALTTVLFWPGSLLSAHALLQAWQRSVRTSQSALPQNMRSRLHRPLWQLQRIGRGRAAELFCLAWLVPGWIVFELARTKLPHYTLPLYPAMALLTGRAVLAMVPGALPRVERITLHAMLGVWLCIGLALGAIPAVLWWNGGVQHALWIAPGAVTALIVGSLLFAAWRAFRAGRLPRTMAAALGALLIVYWSAFTMLPKLGSVWLSPRLIALMEQADPNAMRPVAAVDYHEDSLVFLSRGRVQRIDDKDLEGWLAAHQDGLAVVPSTRQLATVRVRGLGEVEGFNYSKGRWQRLSLFETQRSP